MGFGLFIAALVFFFTPNIDIIDFLPDVIGALLIIRGLNKLSDISAELGETKRAFNNVLYISLAKFVLMFFVPYFNSNDAGYLLVFTFTFGVLELIFLLPAFRKLLDSLLYLGDGGNDSSLFKNRSEFFSFTTIFFVIRALFAVIPDLTYILSDEARGIVRSVNPGDIANYKGVLTAFNLLVTGICGIIWLILGVRYFRGIRKDREFIASLKVKYAENAKNKKGIFIYRRLHFALLIFVAGGVFTLDVISEKIDLLPDFIAAALFLFSSLLMMKYMKNLKLSVVCAVFIPASAAAWAMSVYFSNKYLYVNLFTNIEANELFIVVSSVHALSCAVLGLLYYFMFRTVNEIIRDHTDAGLEQSSAMLAQISEERYAMKKQNMRVFVIGLLSCIISAVRVFLLYDFPVFWMADAVIKIIWLYILIDLVDSLSYSMEYKYL